MASTRHALPYPEHPARLPVTDSHPGLPSQLREIAPEYYNNLRAHTSWCWVLWRFLVDPSVSGEAVAT